MIHKISRRVLFGCVASLMSCMTLSAQDDYVPYSQRGGDYKDNNIDPYSNKNEDAAEPYKNTADEDYKLNYGRRTYIPDVNYSPGDYNDFIVSEQTKFLKKQLRYIKTSVYSENKDRIDTRRQDVINQLDRSLYRLDQIDNYDKNSNFLDEFIALMETIRDVYDIKYEAAKDLSERRASSFEAMQDYFDSYDRMDKIVNDALIKAIKAQESFADQHKLVLGVDDEEFEEELEKTHKALEFSQDVYLLYFKVAKINAYFVDAFNAEDLPMMQRKQKELLAVTAEVSNKLKTMDSFEGSLAYASSTGKLVKFYQTMAKSKYTKIIKSFEEFESFDNMEQTDVNKLNNIIKQYNKQYEDLYDKFAKARKEMLKENIKRDL